MKKLTLLLLAALMLLSVLTACSASANMTGTYPRGYSNVSTTRDGSINGANPPYESSYPSRYAESTYDAAAPSSRGLETDSTATRKSGTSAKKSTTSRAGSAFSRASQSRASGTGMAGGR